MILIVNRQKHLASTVAEIFYYMGILSLPATPTEALREISSEFRAVLVMDPHTLPDPQDFVSRIRSYSSKIPIISISDDGEKNEYSSIFDLSFKHAISSAILASKIAAFSRSRELSYIGDYRLSGIDARADKHGVTFFGIDMGLTKTESMILRYLIRSYPAPKRAQSILKYAFKPSRHPETSSIKTHISVINKKFREMEGRPLITMMDNDGYVILTPQIMKMQKSEENVQAELSYNS